MSERFMIHDPRKCGQVVSRKRKVCQVRVAFCWGVAPWEPQTWVGTHQELFCDMCHMATVFWRVERTRQELNLVAMYPVSSICLRTCHREQIA